MKPLAPGNVADQGHPRAVSGRARTESRVRAALAACARARYAPAAVFVLAGALAIISTALRHFPPPFVHDELSYLLGADTFLHGRLTNPTHLMWRHFETFHVLQRPSYASKFPPAQALVLALGRLAAGQPIAGVWLSFALMCAALLWMLRAWTERAWALAVSLAVACALAPTYWAFSFWGGAVAATGGALVYGAARRIVDAGDGPAPGLALVLGVGLLVLANSRPYEGLLAALPVAGVLGVWLFRTPAGGRMRRWRHLVLPLAAVLLAGAGLMLAYDRAVTGRWLQLPYVAYERQYDPVPLFRFLTDNSDLRPPNAVFASFVAQERAVFAHLQSYPARELYLVEKSFHQLLLPAGLLLVFAALPFAARARWNRFALGALVLGGAGMALTTWFDAHYAAPFLAACAALWAECLRRIAGLRVRRLAIGPVLAGGALALLAINGLSLLAGGPAVASNPIQEIRPRWAEARQALASSLEQRGGRHLVVVSYAPTHSPHDEWVYNLADIDAAPVVWARDLGPGANQALLRYFRSRQIWTLSVVGDSGPYVLRPLPVARTAPPATPPGPTQAGMDRYPQVQVTH